MCGSVHLIFEKKYWSEQREQTKQDREQGTKEYTYN